MGRYRRYLIALAAVVIVVGAYAVAGFWAVPHFARSNLTNFAKTHWGRAVAVGAIRFNPFTLNLDISQFSLPDADGKTLLSFDHLKVGLQWVSLLRLGPSFDQILLQKPYVRAVIRRDGALNLADLGRGFPAEPPPPPGQKAKPLRLYIGRLAVTDGATAFEDRTRPTPFEAQFTPINFELHDFSTLGGKGNAYQLEAASPQGARLKWTGTLELTPLSSRGAFEITEVRAHELWTYVRDSVPFEVTSGTIAVRGTYELAAAVGPLAVKLDVQNATMTQFGVRPKGAPQDYVDLAKLEVQGTHLDLDHHGVDIEKVQLTGGDLKVWLDAQGHLNLLELAPAAAAPGTAPPPAPPADAQAAATPPASAPHAATSGGNPAPWTVKAPEIQLEGFKVAVEDRGVKPAFAAQIDPLSVHVAGFSTASDNVLDITLESTFNHSGKVNAKAKLTAASGELSAHVDAQAVDLSVLQPYLNSYTSMLLLKGALGAQLDLVHHQDGYLAVKGNTVVSGLRTVDAVQKRDFVSWKDLKVSDIDYKSTPQTLRIGNLTAVDPYARLIIFPDRVMNITDVLTPAGSLGKHEAPPPPGKAAAAPVARSAPRRKSRRQRPRRQSCRRNHRRHSRCRSARSGW